MNANASSSFCSARSVAAAVAMSLGLATSAVAHDHSSTSDPSTSQSGTARRPGAAALVQLADAGAATARYLDVDAAVTAGYVDVGAFVPHMGWHYVNSGLIDGSFDPEQPEILVYADDPCSAKRRLVAMEYAIPLALSSVAPAGFSGRADVWTADEALGLWTLHAWVWEYNLDGVFEPFNTRVP
jgi:hypothetical protein